MSSYNELVKIIILDLYYILILIKSSFSIKFLGIKRLSSYDSYFVILDYGLFLYDFNNQDCSLLYKFEDNE